MFHRKTFLQDILAKKFFLHFALASHPFDCTSRNLSWIWTFMAVSDANKYGDSGALEPEGILFFLLSADLA